MKCLTVCQPWAWSIIHGPKRIENRTWRTSHRGPLAIHAGKSRKWTAGMVVLPDGTIPAEGEMVYGALIGVVDVVDCVPYDEVASDPFAIEGHWCWVLERPRVVEVPVPMRGQLSLFEIADELVQVREVQVK